MIYPIFHLVRGLIQVSAATSDFLQVLLVLFIKWRKEKVKAEGEQETNNSFTIYDISLRINATQCLS